jgi:large subunit ribosomal protein L25
MKQDVLKSQWRNVNGPKAKTLRTQGFVPGVVYAKGTDSLPVQVPVQALKKFVKEGHNIFQLEVDSKGTFMVSIDSIDKDAIGKNWLHVNFHQLKKGQEATVAVPLVVVGTAKGTKQGGVFSKLVDEVHVVGIPSNIPETFEVDVTELEAHGQWKLSDLTPPNGTKWRETDLEHAIFSCSVPKVQVVEEPVAEVAAEAPAADVAPEADKEAA